MVFSHEASEPDDLCGHSSEPDCMRRLLKVSLLLVVLAAVLLVLLLSA
jgi:hypothetical protein